MSPHRLILLTLVSIGTGAALSAQTPAYWPQFRGPDRTNVAKDTNLLKEWPKDGPPLVWKITNLGNGLAPVSVVDGRIYTLAFRDGSEFAVALDRGTGKEIWATRVGRQREAPIMQFLRQRQPVIDDDRLYASTGDSELICLETDGGQILWRKDYRKELGATGSYSWCDHPLIDGDRLICTPGGKEATFAALNKRTGELLWKSASPEGDTPAYSPMVVAEAAGIRQYIQPTFKGLVSIAAKDGKFLWRYNRTANGTAVVPTPIVRGDYVFVTSGYGTGSALLKLVPAEGGLKAEEVYFTRDFQNVHGGMVQVGDYVYGGHSPAFSSSIFTCLDSKTGKVVWRKEGKMDASFCVLAADNHLVCRQINGVVTLVEATPDGYREKGRFQPADQGTQSGTWTHPVLAGGRLYLRNQSVLSCYDLRADRPVPAAEQLGPPKEDTQSRLPDAIFVPSPQDVVERMLELAKVKKVDLVVDLGCGDGRIPVTAAKKYGCKAIGYDIDEECIKLSRAKVKENKVEELVQIVQEDVFKVDLSKADVVMLYLLPQLNVKLIPQLEKMKPGARIVSHAFDMKGVVPDQVITYKSKEDEVERKLYLWTVPLKTEKKQ